MVFDHRGGGGGHPKPNPYSDQFLDNLAIFSANQRSMVKDHTFALFDFGTLP